VKRGSRSGAPVPGEGLSDSAPDPITLMRNTESCLSMEAPLGCVFRLGALPTMAQEPAEPHARSLAAARCGGKRRYSWYTFFRRSD